MSTKIKLLIISPNYPSQDNLYGDVFVHSRAKEYLHTFDVTVGSFNPNNGDSRVYNYEGIEVFITSSVIEFKRRAEEIKPDIIAVHLIQHELMNFLLQFRRPTVVFMHGYEALSWRRRLFNFDGLGALPYLITYIYQNSMQLKKFRKFINQIQLSRLVFHFVFVSRWLQTAAQQDVGSQFNNHLVIPNGIDTSLFRYSPKAVNSRKKILLLRSFKARNYANDIAIAAILLLSKKTFFNDLEFCIQGEGYLFPSLTKQLEHFPNIELKNYFVENKCIPSIHEKFGIFLCPSRMDTQGVSMCEAMASGLVPVTSNIGAIPEYCINNETGFLTESTEEIADKIEHLYYNPEEFSRLSKQAREKIVIMCSLGDSTKQEIELMKLMTNDTINTINS